MNFQTMLPGCEAGHAEAWRAFLAGYTPLVFRLLGVYAPSLSADSRSSLWSDALGILAAEDFKRLREFDHQAEREFLADLKSFVLDLARQKFTSTADQPAPATESIRGRLEARPIAHQEILWLRLGGYSPSAVEQVLVIPQSLVAKALESPGGTEPATDSPPGSAAWLAFLHEIHAARTEGCPPRRLFVRILDGQISWYDKTPAENHMVGCLHCLDVWATLREIDFLRRETPPAPDAEVAPFMSGLPLTETASRRSWLGKMLGR